MPVSTPCSEHTERSPQWSRCRDAIGGGDAIRKNVGRYVPRLSDQTTDEYDAYINRGTYYGASGRTLQGLAGAVFRIDPSYEIPDTFRYLADSFTNDGLSLKELARSTVSENISVGRCGLLVDKPLTGDGPAYATLYLAENVINWFTEMHEGRQRLSKVVLRETYEVEGTDEFEVEHKTQYRVLRLEEGLYRVEVWRQAGKDVDSWSKVDDLSSEPSRNGQRLDYIPFTFVNPTSLSAATVKPPLLDLVDVNISHYRTTIDLEHGAHFTALPTAVLAGFGTGKTYRIGSGVAWVSDKPEAKAFFLEYKGAGLSALRDLISDKEKQMAVLGARLLEEQKKQTEAAETHRLRQSGEQASLASVANTVSEAIERCLRWAVYWDGASDTIRDGVTFTLNTDFVAQKLDPQTMTALMAARQAGEISQDTFLYNLKQGEILPPDHSIEDEKELLEVDKDNIMGSAPPNSGTTSGDGDVEEPARTFKVVRDESNRISGLQEG